MGEIMSLKRKEGWEQALDTYLFLTREREFAYGPCDCVSWATEWFAQLVGEDLFVGLRGTYDTEDGANAILAEYGGMEQLIGAFIPRRRQNFEKRGDLAVCEINGDLTTGIVADRGFVFFKPKSKGLLAKRVEIVAAFGVD